MTMTSSLPSPAPDRSPLSAPVKAVVDQAIAEHRLVGAVVLVRRDGRWVHRQAAGMADREAARPMQLDTIFRLASVSKPIVSMAALLLVARGQLDLDVDIRRWLPWFQPRLADGQPAVITPRHLLSHTAGLGYRFFEADAQGPYARAGVSDGMDAVGFDLDENLRRIASVPLAYAPGAGWGYSLATDVLGRLVAQLHGQPLAQAVRALLTGPLEMRDTGFVVDDAARLAAAYVTDQPVPHRLGEGEVVAPFEGTVGIPFSPSRVLDPMAFASAGAGMAGTAGDFLRLLEALRSEALLPPALLDEAGRDQTGGAEVAGAPGFGFGLGFSVLRDPLLAGSPESPGTWRWGGAYGHSWFVDRPQRLSVVAFTNTLYEGMSGRFVADVRNAVYAGIGGAR